MHKLMCTFMTPMKKKIPDRNLDTSCPAGIPCNNRSRQDEKLLSKTFMQDFAETCGKTIHMKHFLSFSLIKAKLSFSWLNEILFCWSKHCAIPHNFRHNRHFLPHNLSPKSRQSEALSNIGHLLHINHFLLKITKTKRTAPSRVPMMEFKPPPPPPNP